MIESKFKSDIMKGLEQRVPDGIHLRLEDRSTSGVPDIVSTFNGMSSWWEAKIARPKIETNRGGIQRLTCRRLARYGYCRYVVAVEVGRIIKATYVVTPDDLRHINYDFAMLPEVGLKILGYQPDFVVQCILGAHGVRQN